MGAAATETEQREPRLDGLRGLAVLMVVLAHATLFGAERTKLDSLLQALPSLGWSGVDLFFVLSGFLITRILLATRDSSSYYGTFWARRALRIFPLYYLVLAFFLLIAPRVPALAELDRLWRAGAHPQGLWYWLYLSNWKVAFSGWDAQSLSIVWSLAIEEQFYIVFPLFLTGLLWMKRFRITVFFVLFEGIQIIIIEKGCQYCEKSGAEHIASFLRIFMWMHIVCHSLPLSSYSAALF